MLVENLTVIAPESVAEYHYFLEELVNPFVLWGIRIGCIAAGMLALLLYFKMKQGKGGE